MYIRDIWSHAKRLQVASYILRHSLELATRFQTEQKLYQQ
jgi:hypothetical protein